MMNEKEQIAGEDATSDLISRQAAIDALGDEPLSWIGGAYKLGAQSQWQSDIDALKALPSAQPEVLACGEGELNGRPDCSDCIKYGGNWECDHIHCHEGRPERKTGKWIVRTRYEHFPSGKEYTELVCPFCGRTDRNGDGCYCGYCGEKMEVEE